MGQTRLFFSAAKSEAEAAFRKLETLLEDDGFPLSISELDEDAGIDEVSVYAETENAELRKLIEDIISQTAPSATLADESLDDVDWVAKSLEGLKPVRVGRFLVHGAHDRAKRRIGDLAIEIEAGLAFGTGHHGTTAGCLELITEVARREPPRNALDLGTGSAVLAIALAKFCRVPVLATDIDPVAVDVAKANIRLNQTHAYVDAVTAAGFHHHVFARWQPFDLIVANILARPLMALAPQMARHLTPGGSLILSGILERQREAVIAAYVGQSFRHVKTIRREGWVALHLKR
ncbi:50S ribosomal protein L11 methyltransferase [Aliihoeflea aestuarii]|uniref:50S ribosomal protein L11 methyltransferase n=1 Tax=Aliihoeflea aestuarii TaxID=453840 RepID=UPI0020960BF1|nr:50S ribosomal protein L11 methyltransferase [Aliihoeflea aestuarii]MCO6392263.1 50S ribosomal protein L11 methyltransferase [Aliihoeflea aestuarii]